MVRRFHVGAAVLLVAMLVMAACGQPEPSEEGATKRVAALGPGYVDDGSFNQYGYEGLKRAAEEFGYEIAFSENVTQEKQVEVFRNYAQQGYDVIIGHGGEYMDAALLVAEEFPDRRFVVTNGDRAGDNVSSITMHLPDSGYLAGVLAAHMSKTGKVAVVTGEEIPVVVEAIEGFRRGAASVNPDIEVLVSVTGSWNDVDKGREAGLALISQGVDVLWPAIDSADAGVMAAAEDSGVMTLGGIYVHQPHLAPNAYIGSVIISASELMYFAATEELSGQVYRLGVAEGAVDIAFGDSVPQEVIDAVRAAEAALAGGEISTR